MATLVAIDPFNRIEGDLRIELEIVNFVDRQVQVVRDIGEDTAASRPSAGAVALTRRSKSVVSRICAGLSDPRIVRPKQVGAECREK